MDQQKRGEFVLLLVSRLHSSFFCLKVGNCGPLHLRILINGMRNPFGTVPMSSVKLVWIFNLKSVMDCYISTFFNLQTSICSEASTFLSEMRRAAVLSSFIAALIRGGPWYPRPIEFHAHDPLRSVGDILAWVHQSIAAEPEFHESLFGMKSGGRMIGSIRKFGSKDEEDWICEPLKVCMAPSFVSFCSSICVRWGCSKGHDHRKVVLCRIKLWNCCSFILWPCGAPLAMMPCC